jgi:hypothetical protein
VSPLWRSKKTRIGVCADRILVSGAKPVAVPNDGSPLEVLSSVLSSKKEHQVSIVLADSFVKYMLLPWNAALRAEDQWLALARHRLATVYGAQAAEWEVKLTATAPQGARLACAIERSLVAQLAERCVAARVDLVSVQPFLVAGFNQIRDLAGAGSCWLVIEEPARLTLAYLQRGAWIAVRSRRVDERWRSVLPEIIERESACLALPETCTRVIVCAQEAFDTGMHEQYRLDAVSYKELALA